MKSKLNLAIIAIILRFVLEYLLSNILYYSNEYNEIVFWIQNILTIVYTLSPLGVLPFLISLYNSNVFSKLMEEKPFINDQLWISHFFKRLISISVVNALPFTILLWHKRNGSWPCNCLWADTHFFGNFFIFVGGSHYFVPQENII